MALDVKLVASVAGGLSLPIIRTLLWHSQLVTTARYAHFAIDPLKQAANLTGGHIAAAMRNGGNSEPAKQEI